MKLFWQEGNVNVQDRTRSFDTYIQYLSYLEHNLLWSRIGVENKLPWRCVRSETPELTRKPPQEPQILLQSTGLADLIHSPCWHTRSLLEWYERGRRRIYPLWRKGKEGKISTVSLGGQLRNVGHLVLSLTCRETHCNNNLRLAGGKRGRRWVIKRCSAVTLPLGQKVQKKKIIILIITWGSISEKPWVCGGLYTAHLKTKFTKCLAELDGVKEKLR